VAFYEKGTCGIIMWIKIILYHQTYWKRATIRTHNTHQRGHGLIKVKFPLERAMKAQRGSRGTALLFL
jgi:hypothetical protein